MGAKVLGIAREIDRRQRSVLRNLRPILFACVRVRHIRTDEVYFWPIRSASALYASYRQRGVSEWLFVASKRRTKSTFGMCFWTSNWIYNGDFARMVVAGKQRLQVRHGFEFLIERSKTLNTDFSCISQIDVNVEVMMNFCVKVLNLISSI